MSIMLKSTWTNMFSITKHTNDVVLLKTHAFVILFDVAGTSIYPKGPKRNTKGPKRNTKGPKRKN